MTLLLRHLSVVLHQAPGLVLGQHRIVTTTLYCTFFHPAIPLLNEQGKTQQHLSLLQMNPWWRHQMEAFSPLLALCGGNPRLPVISPHKGQWRGALVFSLICAWINGWANNRDTGDLRRHSAHYDGSSLFVTPIPDATAMLTLERITIFCFWAEANISSFKDGSPDIRVQGSVWTAAADGLRLRWL